MAEIERQRPVPLPQNVEDYRARKKAQFRPTLNDLVEPVHLELWQENEKYRALREAVWDQDAVEGDIDTDDVLSGLMIKEHAAHNHNHDLADRKIAAIVKALRVVEKRYDADRRTRRYSLHGNVDAPEHNGNGDTN